jgi:archaetidylinositol phosphate synthase
VIKATLGRRADAALHRVFPFLFSRPLNPNQLSVLGVVISLSGAVSFARGALPLGGVLLLVGGFFDVMDGAVARHNGTSSSFGAFLASIATVMVSYTKARAESIVSDFNGGIMERFERVVVLVVGALTGYLPLCLGIVAAGSTITAIQRVAMAYREMAQVDATAQGEKT